MVVVDLLVFKGFEGTVVSLVVTDARVVVVDLGGAIDDGTVVSGGWVAVVRGLNEVVGATVVVVDLLLTIGTSFVVVSKIEAVVASILVLLAVAGESSVEVCFEGLFVAGLTLTTS